MNRLVLFDFDGTMTSEDSMIHFFKMMFGRFQVFWALFKILPDIFFIKVLKKNSTQAKERFLRHFLLDISQDVFAEKGRTYAEKYSDKILLKDALNALRTHQRNGDRVIIVSASIKEWLLPISKRLNVELLCTEYDCNTGKIIGKNCIGPEKVRRVTNHLNIHDYEEIYVYGDSNGDKEMLQLATHKFYRKFSK